MHWFIKNALGWRTLNSIPANVVWGLLLVCVLPYILHGVGVDFANPVWVPPVNTQVSGPSFYALSGAFTHSLLEWSAFCAALFTVVLAFSHYNMNHDVTTPIIAVALFCAGCMDAFHTVVVSHLLETSKDPSNLISITWALIRVFNVFIMMLGIWLILYKPARLKNLSAWRLLLMSLVIILLGVALIYAPVYFYGGNDSLPQMLFPERTISRPLELIPLALFLLMGLFFYPRLCNAHPSLFASALLLSAIPEVMVQLHMVLSIQLFDNHFNIAHFLKIVAYVVPVIGLNLEYARTYRRERENYKQLLLVTDQIISQQLEMDKANQQLAASNSDLEKFAYIASHDLQEPLRKVQAFGDRLYKVSANVLDDRGLDYLQRMQRASSRMSLLIRDLLSFSQVQSQVFQKELVDLSEVLAASVGDLQIAIEESGSIIKVEPLPKVLGDKSQLEMLFRNLLSNAIKFRHPQRQAKISITYAGLQIRVKNSLGAKGQFHKVQVTDNGIGLEEQYSKRIFKIFQRLHSKEKYKGNGIGLALCERIVVRHNGSISVQGELGKGCVFTLLFPVADNS